MLSARASHVAILSSLILLCSCATRKSVQSHPPAAKFITGQVEPVRNVDIGERSDLKELGEHARVFANKMYPKVCAVLANADANSPGQFEIVLKPLKSHNTGETHLEAGRIYINSDYLTNHPALLEMFEKVLIHELAHLAQNYRSRRPYFWSRHTRPHAGWEEGIADYVLYQLVGTGGWACPQCDTRYPHYTSGYTCTGAFLLFVEASCGSNIVQQLNRQLHRGSYSDAYFASATGKSLDDWWAEFQKTPAYKPGAMEAFKLQQALGYVDGRPPRDVVVRFNRHMAQHADAFTRQAVQSANLDGKSATNVQVLMTLYLYFSQPGGSAEKAWLDLREKGRAPGFVKGAKGSLSASMRYDEIASHDYPQSRTLTARKRGDSSLCHYTMVRVAPGEGWKLTKAWRADADGKTIEEFPVP